LGETLALGAGLVGAGSLLPKNAVVAEGRRYGHGERFGK